VKVKSQLFVQKDKSMGNTASAEKDGSTRARYKRPFHEIVRTKCDELSQRVYSQLQVQLLEVEPAYGDTTFCASISRNSYHIHQRLLASFGECTEPRLLSWDERLHPMPLFRFQLNDNTVANLVALYAPAIRCALERCGTSGWIFVGWHTAEKAHATAFFFKDGEQVGFDPSTVLQTYNDREGANVWSYLKENHMWLPASKSPRMSMVDERVAGHKKSLQRLFSTMEDTDDCQLNGCCTTVTILMVWLCLRFGCRDPQVMADALRCVLEHARHRAKQLQQRNPGGENQMMKFLFQLRAWQNRMVDTEDWTHDDFLKWLKIRVEPEARSYRRLRQVAPWP
jgi:hypothetical protein